MSNELSHEEMVSRFTHTVSAIVDYWVKEDRSPTAEEKCSGVAFSILCLIDGCNASMPAFSLIPSPHPDDRPYSIARGEDYYPIGVDIGGALHEAFIAYRKANGKG